MKKRNPQKNNMITLIILSVTPFMLCPYGFAGDREVYLKNCGVCHTLSPSAAKRQGPPLNQIIGRKAGSIKDFPYSDGLRSADWHWSAKTLDRWLENPQRMVPDSYMMYSEKDAKIRQQVIQFLSSNPSS
tara:strand:+ start:363 stop:752 length:390 start_codon:yes stop_codon:yes gene_type:complete